jgi:NAD(P)-dependent dehydrogenase (short-subunit alcohol dehydrogenase family)
VSGAQTPGPETTFVVSGGGRGITAHCVVELARRYGCRFILLGRTSLERPEPDWARGLADDGELRRRALAELRQSEPRPTPLQAEQRVAAILARREVEQTLREVAAAGGHARYLSVDIVDQAALTVALRSALAEVGPERGLIHGAGLLADKPIVHKQAADFETVYGAKVDGLANLLTVLPPTSLRYLILFASAAGFYGNAGQTDYALANEILNKTALLLSRRQPAGRVMSINWGPWSGGMVTPALRARFEQRGIALLPLADGARLLADLLAMPPHSPQVLVGAGAEIATPLSSPATATQRVRRCLSARTNPFLSDHKLDGRAVLPVVCALDWMRTVAEQLYPSYYVRRWAEFRMLKGIVLDLDAQGEFSCDISRMSGHAGEDCVELDATLSSPLESGQQRLRYRSRLTLAASRADAPVVDPPPVSAAEPLEGARFYRDATLFHGPRLQGVQRVLRLDRAGGLAECRLPPLSDRDQGQFPVGSFNAFTADASLHLIAIWLRQHYGVLGLPTGAAAVESFRPLPFDATFYAALRIVSDCEDEVVADLEAYDQDGRLCLRFERVTVPMSMRMAELFAAARS